MFDELLSNSLVEFDAFFRKTGFWQTGRIESGKMASTTPGKTMLFRNLSGDDNQATRWQDLGHGAPTIIGFANLCSQSIARPMESADQISANELSDEAKTILVAAASRGTIDIRADRDSFDSAERFLAVCIEYELEQRLLFLQKENPEQTIRFLDGFRQLCQSGLVVHHLQKDFSLSAAGFQHARSLNRDEFKSLLDFAVKIEH